MSTDREEFVDDRDASDGTVVHRDHSEWVIVWVVVRTVIWAAVAALVIGRWVV